MTETLSALRQLCLSRCARSRTIRGCASGEAGLPRQTRNASSTGCSGRERGVDNPALDCAIDVANELGLPVVAFFSAISNFPRANLRHYAFLNQGLHDVEEDMAERGVPLIVRRPPENKLEPFLQEVGAGIVIGDENPLREPERWRRVLAGRLKIPFWTVDADVVVPSRLFTKGFYAQHLFRRQLDPLLPKYLVGAEGAEAREAVVAHTKDRAMDTRR